MSLLQQKIKEIKLRAAPINYSTVAINERGELTDNDLDKRIIKGYLIVWGVKNDYGEKCIKGCCSKSIRERGPQSNAKYKITFLWQHKQDDPLALFAKLEEDDYGLYFETLPLDDVPNADRALKQVRSKTLNQFSVGFDYLWDKMEWDESDESIVMKELDLFEGSIVTIAANRETYALRSKENLELLHDDTQDFITSLPRSKQLEARQIFARHKELIVREMDMTNDYSNPNIAFIDKMIPHHQMAIDMINEFKAKVNNEPLIGIMSNISISQASEIKQMNSIKTTITARHKTLLNIEPLEQSNIALDNEKPDEKGGVNYNYLTENFSF